MQVDWNPVVHILDALSEGTHSFLELSYMVPDYDREAFTKALLFLADRSLIDLSAGKGPFTSIPKSEWRNDCAMRSAPRALNKHR
jgi:hypothetical protein